MPQGTVTGSVAPSKNARNAGARAAKLAKKGGPIARGGICSGCGQESTSSTTGSAHASCPGFVTKFDFKNQALNFLNKTFPMSADGTVLKRPIAGIWTNKDELLARRTERGAGALRVGKTRVVATSVFKLAEDGLPILNETSKNFFEPVLDRLDITNGLGEPISLVGGAWRTEDEATEYAAGLEAELRAAAPEVYDDVIDAALFSDVVVENETEALAV